MGYAGSAGLQNQYFTSNNTTCGYICYGFGQFDGQGSGHDFSGTVRFVPCVLCLDLEVTFDSLQDWHPPFGFVNNADGSRSHTYVDYRQQ